MSVTRVVELQAVQLRGRRGSSQRAGRLDGQEAIDRAELPDGEATALQPCALSSGNAAEIGLRIVQRSAPEHGARDDRPPARRAVALMLRSKDVAMAVGRVGACARNRTGPAADRGHSDLRKLGERRVDHDIGGLSQVWSMYRRRCLG